MNLARPLPYCQQKGAMQNNIIFYVHLCRGRRETANCGQYLLITLQ